MTVVDNFFTKELVNIPHWYWEPFVWNMMCFSYSTLYRLIQEETAYDPD